MVTDDKFIKRFLQNMANKRKLLLSGLLVSDFDNIHLLIVNIPT